MPGVCEARTPASQLLAADVEAPPTDPTTVQPAPNDHPGRPTHVSPALWDQPTCQGFSDNPVIAQTRGRPKGSWVTFTLWSMRVAVVSLGRQRHFVES